MTIPMSTTANLENLAWRMRWYKRIFFKQAVLQLEERAAPHRRTTMVNLLENPIFNPIGQYAQMNWEQ